MNDEELKLAGWLPPEEAKRLLNKLTVNHFDLGEAIKKQNELRADLHEAAELLRDKVLEITCDVRWERRRDSFLAKLKSLGLL